MEAGNNVNNHQMDQLTRLVRWTVDPRYSGPVAALVLALDAALTHQIIARVPYTEIDWIAYMQQVEQVVAGERVYTQIRGDTGPLVYPAGHVWIFRVLYDLTDHGKDVRTAQYIYLGLYLATLALVLRLYVRARMPPIVLPFLVLSKRLHSIYVLRLFNDCWATFLSVCAISLFDGRKLALAAAAFSLAVSVKMNVLLYAPGAALLFLETAGFWRTAIYGVLAVAVQVAVAVPFLEADAWAYASRAFELSRAFLYKWTVNWRFVSYEKFSSPEFAQRLLILHVLWLVVVLGREYYRATAGRLTTRRVLLVLAKSQLVGVLFARSLHYQFYSWFYWTVPLVLYCTPFAALGPVIWAAQEYGWLVFPSTPLSSAFVVGSLALMVVL